MAKYFKLFIKNGFNSMHKIANLNENALDEMNISSSWNEQKFYQKLNKYGVKPRKHINEY